MHAPLVLSLSCSLFAPLVSADITLYNLFGQTTVDPNALQTSVSSAAPSTTFVTDPGPPHYTQLAAYNPINYYPQQYRTPHPRTRSFFGFSIEMSVATQLIGTNGTTLHVPFLNLMNIVAQRAGAVHIRVGGNTQETAYIVDHLDDGKMMEKNKEDASNPTSTPVLAFTPDLIYMLANVSSLINAKWYLGVPFNDTSNWRLQVAELSETILGDNLLGLQASNEPDLYAAHFHRQSNYGPYDFFGEFSLFTQAYDADSAIPIKNNLIAPSVSGTWTPESVWDTGFVEAYTQYLSHLAVERYPTDNCAVIFPNPNNPPHDPLQMIGTYLTHKSALSLTTQYTNSTMLAQGWGKPFLMFETNTASCGGFPGISDSFTSALWGVDYALQMANSNFTGALFHFGGQNVSYNPFTAAPTNESSLHDWTVGPIFYSSIFVAEAIGQTNTSQVKDLNPNDGNEFTPAFAIYENGNLARIALINFLSDASGANDYTATIYVGGTGFNEPNGVPPSVKVKYLQAPSVTEKDNITWAGQTLGKRFEADGLWKGEENIVTVPCDQAANSCVIKVPAPAAALVFFSDAAQKAVDPAGPQTFPTTVVTKTVNTVTIDPVVLATSNGQSEKNRAQGGTSHGSNAAARAAGVAPGVAALAYVLTGMSVAVRMLW
ncbi:glycoside hydrolase family 79 protein [Trametes elegans]|nr:glycoside hydrolase family 79 protein [Trametes elegans]